MENKDKDKENKNQEYSDNLLDNKTKNGNNSNNDSEFKIKKERKSAGSNTFINHNKINYFNKSSKNHLNTGFSNLANKKIYMNNIDNFKKGNIKNINNIKRKELFKFKSKTKNKFIQNIYSNTTNTNTNTNNTNKKSYKSTNNNTNSMNANTLNNNKQNENKSEKILIDTNTMLYESSEVDKINEFFMNGKSKAVNNKRNKINKKDELKDNNNTNNLDFQTYTMPFKSSIIKVNMVKDSNNFDIKNKKIYENNMYNNIYGYKDIKLKLNKNCKSFTNLKTNNKKNNLFIKTDFRHNTMKRFHSNSEKKIKLTKNKNQTEENYFDNKNNLLKNSKNALNLQIYLSGNNNRKTFTKKKSQNSLTHLNIPKENISLNTNRSLDIKNPYLISSRVNTQKKNKVRKINKKNERELNINDKKIFENKSVAMPEYILKLEDIKSRIYKLLNIYSLIALKSINDSNDISKSKDNKENNE